jgi:hypothetical protein
MSYSLVNPSIDIDTNIEYQEYEDFIHIITGFSSDDISDYIMITLNFPFNNTNIKIKIIKYSGINNIPIFIEDKYGIFGVKMIFNDQIISFGTFDSLNIKNNSIIKIINNMKTGFINNKSNHVQILSLIKSKRPNIRSKLSQEKINENINKYGYWGAFTEEPETPKKKVKKNTYRSPEYNQKREDIDPSELENLGKKYHISMQELFEREQKQKNEEDKLRAKIASLKEKMNKSKDKKNKIIVQEKKETFCGLKKGFLL